MNALAKIVESVLAECDAQFTKPDPRNNKWFSAVNGNIVAIKCAVEEIQLAVYDGFHVTRYEIRFDAPDNKLSAPRGVLIAAVNAALRELRERGIN